jgi:hypothetical protein
VPKVVFPAPESEWWRVEFADGIKMVFTPTLRLSSNMDHPAVKAGYNIMADVARRIEEMAKPLGIKIVFTIIPTKELVYAGKVKSDSVVPPVMYTQLIEQESKNIQWLSDKLSNLEHAEYVDLVKPLQQAAMGPLALYLENINGHPIAAGYHVIAKSLYENTNKYLPDRPKGLYSIQVGKNEYQIILVKDNGVWAFKSEAIIEANGWPPGRVSAVTSRDIAHLPRRGIINHVDKDRFGPGSID